jgi:hypothetical protein
MLAWRLVRVREIVTGTATGTSSDHRDRDKTVIIKKGDHDRDVDHDRRPVVFDKQ